MKMGVWGCLHPQGKKLIASLMVVIVISVFPFNDAFAGEYDDDFATVNTWLNDINGKLALVYAEETNILMQLNQRTISNTYTLRYYIEETYNDQHNMWLQLTTDSQNNTTTIRGYVSNMSSKINSVKTSIDNIATDIGTTVTKLTSISTATSNIYSKLGAMQTSDTNYYTMMNNWQLSWVAYKNQWLDWGSSWNTSIGTINTNIAAINNNLITGFTSIEGKLDTLHTDLSSAYALLDNLNSSIGYIQNGYYWFTGNGIYADGRQSNFRNSWNTAIEALINNQVTIRGYVDGIEGKLDTLHSDVSAISIPNYSTVLNSISGYVDGIEGKLDTLHNDLSSAYSLINNLNTSIGIITNGWYWFDTNGALSNDRHSHFRNSWNTAIDALIHNQVALKGYVDGVEGKMDTFQTTLASLLYETEDINEGIGDVIDAINGLASPTVTLDTTAIQSKLDTIIALLSVPNDTSTIVGDFNTVDFSDDVDNLVDTISELAPFGAVLLISEEVQILASVAPVQEPSLTVPFNFFGNYNMTIDFSWLDDIKPLINYFMLFLLLASLAKISLDFVKVEAGS